MVLLTGITIVISIFFQIRIEYQRNEDSRARIEVSLMSDDLHTYLCLSNIGKRNAWNVHIKINDEFIKELPNCFENKIHLESLCSAPLNIATDEKLYYLLYSGNMGKRMCEDKRLILNIQGTYCNRYKFKKKISINEFINKPPYKLFFKSK